MKRDLDHLVEDAAREGTPEEAAVEVVRASEQLDEAIVGLRRGADLVV